MSRWRRSAGGDDREGPGVCEVAPVDAAVVEPAAVPPASAGTSPFTGGPVRRAPDAHPWPGHAAAERQRVSRGALRLTLAGG
eukprot:Skav209584  [mRNA]  locus=scaffold1318:32238:35929:+ [translate_table: standard]